MASSGIHRQPVDLRALYASLIHGSRSAGAALRLPAADYPVFTPSHEREHLPGHCSLQPDSKRISEISQNLSESNPMEEGKDVGPIISEDGRIIMHPSPNGEQACLVNGYMSRKGSFLHEVPARRTNSGEFRTITCDEFKAIVVSRDTHCDYDKSRNVNTAVASTKAQSSYQLSAKNKAPFVSWLFHKVRKKTKSEMSANTVESENVSLGMFSLEALKKELAEANEKKDRALSEVAQMKSSFAELQEKLTILENHCEELKNALKEAVQGKGSRFLSKKTKPITSNKDSSILATDEVMVEGFVKIVSEARISVKQFCKTLIDEIEEDDDSLISKLNSIIKPHHIASGTKHSRGVFYHLEAFVNQCLFEDFENCVFLKNGSSRVLDPHQDRLQKFSSFVSLRNLRWNELLMKGTEDFSRFCDEKMLTIVSRLSWSRSWPDKLLRAFYVSAKCIWLVHLLAFSFSPPIVILRIEENRVFDSLYMEDILGDSRRGARVKIMVMPGFYVHDRILRCKVLCRYRTVP